MRLILSFSAEPINIEINLSKEGGGVNLPNILWG